MTLTKPRAIFLIASVILSLTILSAGISPRQFEQRGGGIELAFSNITEQAQENPLNTENAGSGYAIPIPRSLARLLQILVVWIIIPAALLYGVFTEDGRRLLKRSAVIGVGMAIGFVLFTTHVADLLQELLFGQNDESGTAETLLNTLRDIHPLAPFAISLLILLLMGILGRILYNHFIKPLLTPQPHLATTAKTALNNLEKGASWQNAIIQCYIDMSDTIRETKGLERSATVTPREFEAYLIQENSLPAQPIQHLTRLFEEARYNPKSTNPTKEQEAKSCLIALQQSSGQATQSSGQTTLTNQPTN